MRRRFISPSFFKNEVLAEIPAHFRLCFIGMWCMADCEGRLENRVKKIKNELFPGEDIDIIACLVELEKNNFITIYCDDKYIQINNFARHQTPHYREQASIIPPPGGIKKEPNKEPIQKDIPETIEIPKEILLWFKNNTVIFGKVSERTILTLISKYSTDIILETLNRCSRQIIRNNSPIGNINAFVVGFFKKAIKPSVSKDVDENISYYGEMPDIYGKEDVKKCQ